MKAALLLVAVALAGCASQPMSPEAAAAFMAYQRSQPVYHAQPVYQSAPVYQQAPAWQAPAPIYMPAQRRCISNVYGGQVQTTCN